jgi:hypothetical protein
MGAAGTRSADWNFTGGSQLRAYSRLELARCKIYSMMESKGGQKAGQEGSHNACSTVSNRDRGALRGSVRGREGPLR